MRANFLCLANTTAEALFAGHIPLVHARGESPWAFVYQEGKTEQNPHTDKIYCPSSPPTITRDQICRLMQTISLHGGKVRGLALLGPVLTDQELMMAPISTDLIQPGRAYRPIWHVLEFKEMEYVKINVRPTRTLSSTRFLNECTEHERTQLSNLMMRYQLEMQQIHNKVLQRAYWGYNASLPIDPETEAKAAKRAKTIGYAYKIVGQRLMRYEDHCDFWPRQSNDSNRVAELASLPPGCMHFTMGMRKFDEQLARRVQAEFQWLDNLLARRVYDSARFYQVKNCVKSSAVFAMASLVKWPVGEVFDLLESTTDKFSLKEIKLILQNRGPWLFKQTESVAFRGRFLAGYGHRICAVVDGLVTEMSFRGHLSWEHMPLPDLVYSVEAV
jgi:hypothetical protein